MFSQQQINLNPSRQLRAIVFGLVVLAAYCLWLAKFPWFIYVLLYPVLTVQLSKWWRRYISLQEMKSVIKLRWQAKEQLLSVCLASGQWLSVTEVEQRLIWPWLTAIRVSVECPVTASFNILILSDSVSQLAQYRQFRVMCRFARVRNATVKAGITTSL